jgi:hypothetical protein
MRFQVLEGKHQVSVEQPGGDVRYDVYVKGDIIETDENLAARWNTPGSKKFARVADIVPPVCSRPVATEPADAPPPPPVEPVQDFSDPATDEEQSPEQTFANMTKAQLVAVAEENEIDLEGRTRKDEILAAVTEFAGV